MEARIEQDSVVKPGLPQELVVEDKSQPKQDKKVDRKQTVLSICKEIIILFIILGIIIGSLCLYSGHWPPIAVVESDSMMHGEDSSIGTIDTGDIILVKKVASQGEIKTYVDGLKSGYQTYNSYGDVIIFKKNGGSGNPVIHRVVVWVEYNASGYYYYKDSRYDGSFDIPSRNLNNIQNYTISNYKPNNINLEMDFTPILNNFHSTGREPDSGFITKGDNNKEIDQVSLKDSKGRLVEPVKFNWILGKAEGEIPGLGLIKLYVSGDAGKPGQTPPPTSVNILIFLIVLIVITIILSHFLFIFIEKKRRRRRELEEDKKLLPFMKRIDARLKLSGKKSKKRPSAIHRQPKVVPKEKMLDFLDDFLEIDGKKDFGSISEPRPKLSPSIGVAEVQVKNSHRPPPARPVSKTDTSISQKPSIPKPLPTSDFVRLSPVINHPPPPLARKVPKTPMAVGQSTPTHKAPMAIPVSKNK